MPIETNVRHAATVLIFLAAAMSSGAQTEKASLDSYIAKSVAEADIPNATSIKEWSTRHPGEVVEDPLDKGSDYEPQNIYKLSPREQQDMRLEERWCLRSLAEIDLAGGIHVRRVALFYQPLVEEIYGKPLPPLPTETGDALRNHGCRLVKIMHEFKGVPDPQKLVEVIAKQMPGKRSDEPGKFIQVAPVTYWQPISSFEKFGDPISYHYLYVRDPKIANAEDQPAVLLEWQRGTLEYGQPSSKTIQPEAGQPWLALRAAMLANLPTAPTLDMLSFLAPQVGDPYGQAPLHCERQLIPVLRTWFDLAAQSPPQQHAAAILLADRVLGRLWGCEEFSNSGAYVSPEDARIRAQDHDSLEKDLKGLDIRTETSARLGNEYYAGNLLEQVLKLEAEGAANELGHMAILDRRCRWNDNSDSVDCRKIIQEGETFLTRFPEDEWTPSVHLILAEAYAVTASNPDERSAPAPPEKKAEWQRKAATHYRAWYVKSKNERDRVIVWQEIWALQAEMGPWLLTPYQSQQ